ncbi:hypothetical protein BSIN_1698 [Burkholderia singularis]|uniref:Uncharacterized protein n=1 Tax=Burkholderia singularis TaxID=1503053 RepID=A0A238GZN1_9BURK|nr:hypothetical protein BSIN_1698 [Burkholderia singularis]
MSNVKAVFGLSTNIARPPLPAEKKKLMMMNSVKSGFHQSWCEM